MRLVNLTGHDIVLVDGGGGLLTVPPSGKVARCQLSKAVLVPLAVDGGKVALRCLTPEIVRGLPLPEAGTMYLASQMVVAAARRPDVLSVMGVRTDAEGRVVAARGLARLG